MNTFRRKILYRCFAIVIAVALVLAGWALYSRQRLLNSWEFYSDHFSAIEALPELQPLVLSSPPSEAVTGNVLVVSALVVYLPSDTGVLSVEHGSGNIGVVMDKLKIVSFARPRAVLYPDPGLIHRMNRRCYLVSPSFVRWWHRERDRSTYECLKLLAESREAFSDGEHLARRYVRQRQGMLATNIEFEPMSFEQFENVNGVTGYVLTYTTPDRELVYVTPRHGSHIVIATFGMPPEEVSALLSCLVWLDDSTIVNKSAFRDRSWFHIWNVWGDVVTY
jgi:hypothetical protein